MWMGLQKRTNAYCVCHRASLSLFLLINMTIHHPFTQASTPEQAARLYGRHFDYRDELVSKITRKSIDIVKDMFRDEMSKDDWRLVIKLKKIFNID